MNRAKNRFDDILDPFEIAAETFVLNLATGDINPNPEFSEDVRDRAEATIERLGLRDPETKRMRARHFQDYLEHHVDEDYLKRMSPFVWYEANRQGLL